MIDLINLTEDELNALNQKVQEELKNRYFLATAQDQILQISEKYEDISQGRSDVEPLGLVREVKPLADS